MNLADGVSMPEAMIMCTSIVCGTVIALALIKWVRTW